MIQPTEPEVFYQIALTMVQQVGVVHARNLLMHFHSAENVFKASLAEIEGVQGIGTQRAKKIRTFTSFSKVETEIRFLNKYGIRALHLFHPDYPQRLLNCYDPPTLLYYKGNADLNARYILAIIGTRMNTAYGKAVTEQLIKDLPANDTLVVSGLAYGIDSIAHRACLSCGIPTIGVVAHGLDTVYPPQHSSLAKDMTKNGGLLSEFMSYTKPDRHNFPTRNRIVAGMCDATVVIETSNKGGSMITAEIANGYHRDVFAVPGRTTDLMSTGTNQMIATNKAMLITNTRDLLKTLGWETSPVAPLSVQRNFFVELTEDEKSITELLKQRDKMMIDEIGFLTKLSSSSVATALLNLEMSGVITRLPGKSFQLL
jgi:DNA processing protein